MGDATRQGADGFHFLGLAQLIFELSLFFLRPLGRGYILDHAGNQRFVPIPPEHQFGFGMQPYQLVVVTAPNP